MEIVIKIDDEVYKNAKSINWANMRPEVVDDWEYIVANGIPLPKGHGRLIDESLLIEDMKCIYKAANELMALGFAESCIEHIPTIIEADGGGEDDLKT